MMSVLGVRRLRPRPGPPVGGARRPCGRLPVPLRSAGRGGSDRCPSYRRSAEARRCRFNLRARGGPAAARPCRGAGCRFGPRGAEAPAATLLPAACGGPAAGRRCRCADRRFSPRAWRFRLGSYPADSHRARHCSERAEALAARESALRRPLPACVFVQQTFLLARESVWIRLKSDSRWKSPPKRLDYLGRESRIQREARFPPRRPELA